MAQINDTSECKFCGMKEVPITFKQTKNSRTVKVGRCKNCKRQNHVKAILNN